MGPHTSVVLQNTIIHLRRGPYCTFHTEKKHIGFEWREEMETEKVKYNPHIFMLGNEQECELYADSRIILSRAFKEGEIQMGWILMIHNQEESG